MSQAFTHYWTNDTFKASSLEGGEPLNHTASNVFLERGVDVGDRVYVVTIQKGVLHLVGRLVVGAVVDREQAEAALDYVPWEASDHLLASECTPMRFDRAVSSEIASQLRFEGVKGDVPLKFKATGGLDEQTLRGVRRLSAGGANLFDALLADEPLVSPEWPDFESDDDDEIDVRAPLIEYFDEAGYAYELDEDGDLIVGLSHEGQPFDVLGQAVGPLLDISVALPIEVPESRRAAVAEAVVRKNAADFAFSIVFFYDKGLLRYRSVTRNDALWLGADRIGGVFEATMQRAILFSEFLQQVVDDAMTPKDAIDAAFAKLDELIEAAEDDEEADDDEESDDDEVSAEEIEFRERARKLVPVMEEIAGRSASSEAFFEAVEAEVGVDSAQEIYALFTSVSSNAPLKFRTFGADGKYVEMKVVEDSEDLYRYARRHLEERRANDAAERRLSVDVAPGTPRGEVVERLMRNAGDQGRRFLFRADIEKDILPFLSDPITADQSEALVQAGQLSCDLSGALRVLSGGK